MIGESCEIVERPPLTFWFRAKVTLHSTLAPQQVRQQLQNALPRMNVPPDAGTLMSIKRVYTGRVQDSSFSLQGPWGKHTGATIGVRGTVSSHPCGSSIELTIYPYGAIAKFATSCACGFLIPILWWLMDGAFSAGPLFFVVVFTFLGMGSYVLGLIGVGTQLGYLVDHLQSLFAGNPPVADPPDQQTAVPPVVLPPSTAAPPQRRPAIDHTWSTRATLMMIGAFVMGGAGVFISCTGVTSIFLVPAYNRHRAAARMVETPCEIVDSRIELRKGYIPEMLIRYEVEGTNYETWAYRFEHINGFASQSEAEQVLRKFVQGEKYPCWYDPLDPKIAVLDRRSNAWIVLPFAALFTVFFFGPSVCAVIVGFVLLRKLRRGYR
jgi:hypothetical protein